MVRPYPAKTAGIPLKFEYEVTLGAFVFEWSNPSPKNNGKASVSKPPLNGNGGELKALETEIYIPHMLTQGRKVFVSGLDKNDRYFHDEERQTLFIVASDTKPGRVHRVEVVIAPQMRPIFYVNDFWGDWGSTVAGFGFATSVLIFVIAYIIYTSYIR